MLGDIHDDNIYLRNRQIIAHEDDGSKNRLEICAGNFRWKAIVNIGGKCGRETIECSCCTGRHRSFTRISRSTIMRRNNTVAATGAPLIGVAMMKYDDIMLGYFPYHR